MQYLLIDRNDTLSTISKAVGSQNVDALLAENGLTRSPNIGKQWKEKCDTLVASGVAEVTATRKATLLNALTGSEEVFEKACLMDEDEWKVFSAYGAFGDALKIPETIKLPNSAKVIGDATSSTVAIGSNAGTSGSSAGRSDTSRYGTDRTAASSGGGGGGSNNSRAPGSVNTSSAASSVMSSSSVGRSTSGSYSGSNSMSSVTGVGGDTRTSTSNAVSPVTYRAVMQGLKTEGTIDPGVFNGVNTSPMSTGPSDGGSPGAAGAPVNLFSNNLPWGEIQIYSSLLSQVMDIPAYPEELETARQANYTTMPDIIYQYEPWIVYQSSGPREQTLSFHLHRDMWTGNHLDGKANELIRFCEANTFPRYSGSAVLAPQVRIYIAGSLFISGVLTQSRTHWSGPIGQDGWYLEFTLDLTIQEVSETALNVDTVSKFGLIGG